MPVHDMKDQSPDEIAAMLERERQDLAVSIDGLRNSLSVDTLIGDALDYATSNIRPYARVLDGAVRANPMAAIMAGVGLAWLVLGRKSGAPQPEAPLVGTRFEALSRWEDEGGPPAPLPDPADTAWIDESDALRARASDELARIDADARQKLRPAVDLALDRAGVLADLAKATQAAMRRGLESLSSDARDRVLALREQAYAARTAAVRQGTRLIEERPLVAGAIGLAIGAAVATALPRTPTEDRLFGPERDRLLARAHEALRRERMQVSKSATRLADSVTAEVAGTARDHV
jgi:ElaB/YqjD/DUF883 family membrane-anchored ribosome-binding protein